MWSTFSDAIPIAFEESTYSVGEQDGSLEICAVAPATLEVSVAVTVQATGGTAQGESAMEHRNHMQYYFKLIFVVFFFSIIVGSDYSGLPGTLSFTPTISRTQCLTIQIVNDALPEQTETILLLLSGNIGGSPVTPAQATVSIIDDDGTLYTKYSNLAHVHMSYRKKNF